MSSRTRTRRYKRKMWNHWRSFGNCGRCGEPTNINYLTGKPYAECFKHRLETANRKRLSMRRLRKSH